MQHDTEREARLEWMAATEAVRELLTSIRASTLDDPVLSAVDRALRARQRWLRVAGRIDQAGLFRHPE